MSLRQAGLPSPRRIYRRSTTSLTTSTGPTGPDEAIHDLVRIHAKQAAAENAAEFLAGVSGAHEVQRRVDPPDTAGTGLDQRALSFHPR